jgi:hypothetical protein
MQMARRKPIPQRKRRTREHVIADLSINYVERQAFLCGFAVNRIVHDYGLDLFLSTYTADGEIENGYILFQVKATDHLETVAAGQFAVCRVQQTDLRYWLGELEPVILVIYDATADVAYWLHVQDHFASQPKQASRKLASHVSLRIHRSNRLDPAGIRLFAQFRDRAFGRSKGGN